MDFLRAGELLLRSSQPLLPFLAPAISRPRRITILSQHHRSRRVEHQTSRSFATSHPHQQQNAAAAKEDSGDSSQPATSPVTDEFSRLLDGALSSDKGVPTAPTGRTSRFKTPSAQDRNSPSRQVMRAQQQEHDQPTTSPRLDDKSAVDELFNAILDTPNNRTPARRASSYPPGSTSSLLSSALDPLGHISGRSTAFPTPTQLQAPPMKLSSSLGRTIPVDPTRGLDVARAFRALEQQCARNRVKRDFMQQRFHERPGLKRKRLRRERWRKRFKEEFRETVKMVQRLRGQGW